MGSTTWLYVSAFNNWLFPFLLFFVDRCMTKNNTWNLMLLVQFNVSTISDLWGVPICTKADKGLVPKGLNWHKGVPGTCFRSSACFKFRSDQITSPIPANRCNLIGWFILLHFEKILSCSCGRGFDFIYRSCRRLRENVVAIVVMIRLQRRSQPQYCSHNCNFKPQI